ncbi:MAG: NADH-quinone oxidoreductase subunit NuoH [Actinomycetota bacterium]|nr:NADH-quinone oxidoreductase subunit NuoH [Actinomycetota bacterium]
MIPMLAAGDPLFAEGVDLTVVLIVIGKTVVVFGAMLVSVLLLIWFERKLVADMQDRIGPARAGPFGVLQTLADGIKLFFKEDLLPTNADRRVYRLAPYLATVPAFLSFAIVPIGGTVTIAGRQTRLQLADPPVGILFLLAMSSIAVYGVMLAGWSSGSKYPLLGAVRGSAQMVSYEAALGLSTVAVVLVTGSLLTSDIVAGQSGEGLFGVLPGWNVLRLGVVPFVVFFIAGTAESNRPPFDLVEAEQELVGGFHTEYSALRFALFFLAEFMNTITISAIMVTLFLGGPSGPGPDSGLLGAILPVFWFLLKVFAMLCVFIWLRATLPRFRYDQLMDLGWKKLIPLSLIWLLVQAALLVDLQWGIAVTVGGAVMAVLLWRAMQVSQEATEEDAPAPPRFRQAR